MRRIHFRLAAAPTPNPDKYADELLDAYLFVEDADALYAEYAARGVEFTRALGETPGTPANVSSRTATAGSSPSARTRSSCVAVPPRV